jgi:cytochrome P450
VSSTSVTATPAPPSAPRAGRSRDRGNVELVRFLSDVLGYIEGMRDDERDLVPFKLGNLQCHLVTKPEYLKQAMFNEDWPPISRGRLTNLQKWYTTGLFLTYGPDHHRQRDELWKPLFEEPRITEIAVERTASHAAAWQQGAPVELYTDLRDLCWTIDWQALTGEDIAGRPDILRALKLGVDALAWLPLPWGLSRWNWPVPQSRNTRAAKAKLDALITERIAERRPGGNGHDDLLARLVQQAERDGVTDDEHIRATFKMWFGADQLYALFAWTLHLLARNPQVEERWHAELDEVLGDRPATADDVSKLVYTRNVLKESMRAVPPVWGFFRMMTDDYQLGDGAVIPKGDLMAMSPWFTHRDPRLWPDPHRFDPERWVEGAERPPDLSYFPFSGGPYECHGNRLAMKEAVLIMATLGQRWSYRHADSGEPRPTAKWATEPKGGLRMNPVPR